MYKADARFVDLIAVYDTIWHHGLTCKLLRLVPNRHVMNAIMEFTHNRQFTDTTSTGLEKRLRHLEMVSPRDRFWCPVFNMYTYTTTAKKFAYIDDLVFMQCTKDWKALEEVLSQDTVTLTTYFEKWKLNFSTAKTVSASFHLNNK